jgi:hypothetical protein
MADDTDRNTDGRAVMALRPFEGIDPMALTGLEVLSLTGTQFNGSPSSVQESVTCREVANLGIAQRGTFVATGATPVAVAFAGLKSTMVISVSLNTTGGAVGARPTVQTITPGTGFTITASAGDTSTYSWIAE